MSRITIENVQCYYPTLAEAKAYQDGDHPKYGIKLLIPKSDKGKLKEIRDFYTKGVMSKSEWTGKQKAQVLKVANNSTDAYNDNAIFKDGDKLNLRRVDEKKEPIVAYAGHYIIGASRREDFNPVVVVDQQNKSILKEKISGQIQTGYFINVNLQLYLWDKPKSGVSFTLVGVQKVKEYLLKENNPFEALDIPEDTEFDDDEKVNEEDIFDEA